MAFNRFFKLSYRLIDVKGYQEFLNRHALSFSNRDIYPVNAKEIISAGGTVEVLRVSHGGDAIQVRLGTGVPIEKIISKHAHKFFAPIEPEPMCIEAIPPNPNPFEEIHDNIIQFPRKNRVMVVSTPVYHPPQMTYGTTEGVERRLPTPIEAFRKHYPGQDWSLEAVAARAA
ncbi:hypothetical protein ZZ1p0019 [Acinetobacter phage ZZ1]|jgi:hypothetical protein|nr:hypothetical protein ZZ1p0019 [Acinetobacter phage ZZ1]AHE63471.1 hypothetical protein ZZ1p0019 [Acinetobacter phage ZZ1]